jgi:uncharacterized protein (TIGR03435 family)
MKVHRYLNVLLCSAAVFAQPAPTRAEFEVASIKPSGPMIANNRVNVGVHIDGAQVRINMLSLKEYAAMAYKLKLHQIAGPEWIGSDRFDIAAKLPGGATRDQVPDMLQALLEDRFQMKVHRESKEFPVYALTVAKGGVKFKESPPDTEEQAAEAAKGNVNVSASGGPTGTVVSFGKGSTFTFGNNRIEGKKLPMSALAETLGRFVDRPVIDLTELKPNYDFVMEFTPEDFRAMMIRSAISAGVVLPPQALKLLEGVSGDSLFTAIQTLGLKLESRKAPIEVLVIDQVQKNPTAN